MAEGVAELRSKVRSLRDALLKDATPEDAEDAVPSEDEAIRIRAYIVLAHGGIEELVEDTIAARVEACFASVAGGAPITAIPLAMAHGPLLMKQSQEKAVTPQAALQALPGLYRKNSVSANHGIRRKNIEALCKPLGLSLDDLEPVASLATPALETLAAKRGLSAHTLQGASNEIIFAGQAERWVEEAIGSAEQLLQAILVAIL